MVEKLEQLSLRVDKRWAHPELETLYENSFGHVSKGVAGTILNSNDYTLDERLGMKRMMEQSIAKRSVVTDDAARKRFLASGCEEELDAPGVILEVVYPDARRENAPCLYYITGGGQVTCVTSTAPLEFYAKELDCVVIAVNYRTLLEGGGYPQSVNDCHAGYKWIVEHANELGIDPDKIVICGKSSGSQLALALCHRLKRFDWLGHKPCGCVALSAITDDRVIYPSNRLMNYAWNSKDLAASCRNWLGDVDYTRVPAEAFPNRASAEDCMGLPPTFFHTEEHDASCDACAMYASKLVEAGVYTEMHRWGGMNHGLSDPLYESCGSGYMKRVVSIILGNISDCMNYDMSREWTKELQVE